MKIYIIFPGYLFPIQGMSQVRMYNQLACLSRDHEIVFSDLVSNSGSKDIAGQKLSALNIAYHPVKDTSFGRSRAFRIIRSFHRRALCSLTATTMQELSLKAKPVRMQIMSFVRAVNPAVLIIHYWYLGYMFKNTGNRMLHMIDTHYVVEENIELLDRYGKGVYSRWILKRELSHSLEKQRQCFHMSDLVIVNSQRQKELIKLWDEAIPVSVIANGQDLKPFLDYIPEVGKENAICFYGALSNQFNRRALQRIIRSIYPQIRFANPDVKLYVIGANPPHDVLGDLQDGNIVVTGFVEDIRPWLSRCNLLLLPLETSSGFRGRLVEAMALGIPTVGTYNALQSVGFVDGKHGFMAETDYEIAQYVIDILENQELLNRMSDHCRKHAALNFSLEATFHKLSAEISALGDSTKGINPDHDPSDALTE